MRPGIRLPAQTDALLGSETKFGYKHNIACQNYQYVVEGVKVSFQQVMERASKVGLPESTIKSRLYNNYTHTWEQLLRPTKTSRKSPEEKAAANAKRSAQMKRRRALREAGRQARADKAEHFKKRREAHKQLENPDGK